MAKVKCPYCGAKADLVNGATIYPHREDLYHLNFYYCDRGHSAAYVGCHKGTARPLGRLADANLRAAKSRAHQAFDPLWKEKHMSRSHAYAWLAETLGIPADKCHIGMFNEAWCAKVVTLSIKKLEELEKLGE